ncbi:MAG: hypothetical protein FWF10_06610 [Clostridiales bacterium]|nr:hypothetical protein [Clostridiales bacterium]
MKGYPTNYKGIIFVETPLSEGQIVSKVQVDLSFKIGAQLKNLNDVKDGLVSRAKALHCNCISDFKYGQKSRWIAIDDVAYFGSGTALRLPEDAYQRILDYIQNRDS